jgi:site-specific DNA-methyltransferase (adenine-specific)
MGRAKPYKDGKRHPQTIQRFVVGDCETKIPAMAQAGLPTLAILDPPYNLGKKYDAYDDCQRVHDFIQWLQVRVACVRQALHDRGTMWLFINDGLVSEVDLACKTVGFYKRSHVIWYYTFGVNNKKQFTPSHTHLLYYTKSRNKWTFNPDPVMHPSARQLKYKDKRANPKGRLPDNTWVIFPELLPEGFDPAGDTWLASRVCGTFNERESYSPNQIPLPIMERIVLACSNPGDWVLDPFMGTGTAGVACKKHDRNYLGIDISKVCVEESKQRVENA